MRNLALCISLFPGYHRQERLHYISLFNTGHSSLSSVGIYVYPSSHIVMLVWLHTRHSRGKHASLLIIRTIQIRNSADSVISSLANKIKNQIWGIGNHVYIQYPPIVWNHHTSATALPHSWWTSMPMPIWGPWQCLKDLLQPPDKLYGRPSLMSSPGQPSPSGVLISPMAQKAVWHICVDHIQLWAVAVCKVPFQIKVAIMPTNIRPVIIENIVRVLVSHRGRCWELVECHKVSPKSPTPCLWAVVLLRGYVGIY